MESVTSCQLSMPGREGFYDHITANAKLGARVVRQHSHAGQSVVICGAGPSLADHAAQLPHANHVWACNSALPYLKGRKVRVTHGVSIDQGEAMLAPEEWAETFNVHYLLASCVHPSLTKHLKAKGRSFTWFHSYLGIPDPEGWVCPPTHSGEPISYEMYLYQTLYAPSVQVGYGLNSVPRAVCLAIFMGFSSITVYGADCACAPDGPPMPPLAHPDYPAWLNGLRMYADGRNAGCYGRSVMAEAPPGSIDHRRWHTRADMLVSARHLLELQKAYPDRITFVGDTLLNALQGKDDAFWARMPALTGAGLVSTFGLAA